MDWWPNALNLNIPHQHDQDKIVEFKVLIRPRKGMEAVGEHMLRTLQASG